MGLANFRRGEGKHFCNLVGVSIQGNRETRSQIAFVSTSFVQDCRTQLYGNQYVIKQHLCRTVSMFSFIIFWIYIKRLTIVIRIKRRQKWLRYRISEDCIFSIACQVQGSVPCKFFHRRLVLDSRMLWISKWLLPHMLLNNQTTCSTRNIPHRYLWRNLKLNLSSDPLDSLYGALSLSNDSYCVVLSYRTIYIILNKVVLFLFSSLGKIFGSSVTIPFKRELLKITFLGYCLLCCKMCFWRLRLWKKSYAWMKLVHLDKINLPFGAIRLKIFELFSCCTTKQFLGLGDKLILGRTSKITPPPWYKGAGLMESPLGFWLCYNISKRFHLYSKKACDLLYKTRYILWVAALLGGLWRHSR